MPVKRFVAAVSLYLVGALAACLAIALLLPGATHDLITTASVEIASGGTSPGVDDGFIEDGDAISPFADELPAIANLEPALREALHSAARAANADGVEFVVTSGWRSSTYQQWLLDAAIADYGSLEAASEFVLPPEKSEHVTGNAVDIGRTDANSWLSQNGADYGLCQIYANEMWHFELATAPGGQCPAQLSDAGMG